MTNLHVVIPDAHSKPGTHPRRFIALGKFLKDFVSKNKDANIKIIELGDFEDMPSLSSFDIGTIDFEGQRLKNDIETACEHREFVYGPLIEYLDRQTINKKKVPQVQMFALGGNHFEGRLNRYLRKHPELHDLFNVQTLMPYHEWHLTYVPYLTPVELDGISYVHYWQQKGSHRPLATGKYPGQVLIRELHASTVVGHSHVFDRATTLKGDGRGIFALSAGCFLDPDEIEKYAGEQGNKQWWRGLSILYGVRDGFPTGGEEYIGIERLIADYS